MNRQSLYRAYPTAWIFLACPPDPSVRCISPGFYAVIGASAMLAGVTRMTSVLVDCLSTSAFFLLIRQLISVSLVVILFEVNPLYFLMCHRLTFESWTVDGCAISCTTHHDLCHDIKVGRRRDG
jgi:hypothetical protein